MDWKLISILACMASAPGFVSAQDEPAAPASAPQAEPPASPVQQPATASPTPDPKPIVHEDIEAVIWMRDGQRMSGVLVQQNPDIVTLRVGGVTTNLERSTISQIEILPPILERYLTRRAAIPDDAIDQRLMLAEWLVERSSLELAMREIDGILAVEPSQTDALALKKLVGLQLKLKESAEKRRASMPKVVAEPADRKVAESIPLLSAADINLIKVYEVNLADPPKMIIERDTITKLLQSYPESPLIPLTQEGRDALYRKPPAEILELLFQLQARELYSEVMIRDNPESMRRFRDQVHGTWLINSCATPTCHGGAEAGRFRLASKRPNQESTFYTNFLILERYRTADGQPLLDYNDPVRSPLLQLGLKRSLSNRPHPIVPDRDGKGDLWKRPVFQDVEERSFVQAADWIRSLYRPRPAYPIEYPPRGAGAGVKLEPSANPAKTVAPPVKPSTPR